MLATVFLLVQFSIAEAEGPIVAGSVAFVALVVYELVRLVVLRTNYNIPWFSNPWLSVALVMSFAVILPVLFVDSIADLFSVAPISSGDWMWIGLISIAIFVFMKITRMILNRFIQEVNPQYAPEHYERAG